MKNSKTLEGYLTIDTPRGRAIVNSFKSSILFDNEPQYADDLRYKYLWHIDEIPVRLTSVQAQDLWMKTMRTPENEKGWLEVVLIVREEGKLYRGKAIISDFPYTSEKINTLNLRGVTELTVEEF